MEDHSAVDISIRNVAVRLNDSNISSELNGGCVNSMYVSSSPETETQVTRFNEECEGKYPKDISDEFREKLHVCNDSGNCGFLNGCNKLLHEDMKHVDLSVNGISKGSNFELLNAHLSKLNHRTCDQTPTKIEIQNGSNENHPTIPSEQKCLISDVPQSEISQCSSNSCLHCDQSGTDVVSNFPSGVEVTKDVDITYLGYESERQMPDIMRLIQKDLSEPYSIYTYRYFIHNWPKLCFLAQDGDRCVGAIVCKLDAHKKLSRRGYIAMLAVDEKYRKRKIGSCLVLKAIHAMVQDNADEVVLETEITNKPALRLYENLGFVRDKRLFRYYLNGVDALRLKLWLR